MAYNIILTFVMSSSFNFSLVSSITDSDIYIYTV